MHDKKYGPTFSSLFANQRFQMMYMREMLYIMTSVDDDCEGSGDSSDGGIDGDDV
jgi:hypothetical protein